MLNKSFILTALGLAIVSGASAARAQDATAGGVVYKRCAICHSTTGTISVGPPLNGIVGRKGAGVPKYTYSKAMAGKAIVWDAPTLDKFLARPQALVPGTKMGFAGLTNPKDRQNLIAYLATLKK